MNKKIITQEGQTIFDIAIQEKGGVDSLFTLIEENNIDSVNKDLSINEELTISDDNTNGVVKAYYNSLDLKVNGWIKKQLPYAKVSTSKTSEGYKDLTYSALLELKDYNNNPLTTSDEVTFIITSLQTNVHLGTATYKYGDVIQTDSPISSDYKFSTYIEPNFSGTIENGGTLTFNKYAAVSSWNLANNTLAGIDKGEDWKIEVIVHDNSESASSINIDNWALFNKSIRYMHGGFQPAFDGSFAAYAVGYNDLLPNEGLNWQDPISFILNSVVKPNVSPTFSGSNTFARYFLKTYTPTSPMQILEIEGYMNNYSDFLLPSIFCKAKFEHNGNFNHSAGPKGIYSVNYLTNILSCQYAFRDNAREADFLEIWQSNTPLQQALLGTRVLNVANPINASFYSASFNLSGSEGIYNIYTRNITGGVTYSFNDSQIIKFSI